MALDCFVKQTVKYSWDRNIRSDNNNIIYIFLTDFPYAYVLEYGS